MTCGPFAVALSKSLTVCFAILQGYHLIESITKYYQGRARMVAKVRT